MYIYIYKLLDGVTGRLDISATPVRVTVSRCTAVFHSRPVFLWLWRLRREWSCACVGVVSCRGACCPRACADCVVVRGLTRCQLFVAKSVNRGWSLKLGSGSVTARNWSR